jgi:hypothetical protein
MATDSTSGLPDNIKEEIAIGNLKSIAQSPAALSNLALANLINNVNLSQQNAVANQQAMNQLGIAITGKAVDVVSDSSASHPVE